MANPYAISVFLTPDKKKVTLSIRRDHIDEDGARGGMELDFTSEECWTLAQALLEERQRVR